MDNILWICTYLYGRKQSNSLLLYIDKHIDDTVFFIDSGKGICLEIKRFVFQMTKKKSM